MNKISFRLKNIESVRVWVGKLFNNYITIKTILIINIIIFTTQVAFVSRKTNMAISCYLEIAYQRFLPYIPIQKIRKLRV